MPRWLPPVGSPTSVPSLFALIRLANWKVAELVFGANQHEDATLKARPLWRDAGEPIAVALQVEEGRVIRRGVGTPILEAGVPGVAIGQEVIGDAAIADAPRKALEDERRVDQPRDDLMPAIESAFVAAQVDDQPVCAAPVHLGKALVEPALPVPTAVVERPAVHRQHRCLALVGDCPLRGVLVGRHGGGARCLPRL